MRELSDNNLISSYLSGNEQALETLVKRYLKVIYWFVYRYAGEAATADDLTQEVFVRAWRNLKKFDRQKSFKTWLFAIAKNASLDFLKKKKTIPFSALDDAEGNNAVIDTLIDPSPLPQELLEKAGMAQILAFAMKQLSPKYRKTVLLRHNDDLTFREIAETLGEPLNTVKSRYRRARLFLKKILSES